MVDRYLAILKEYWGYDDFRGIQRQIIESVCSGHDTLGLMPTGGGKSITFQVSALALGGTCLVITPLIALMKDQVNTLRQKGIQAEAVYAGMRNDKILQIYDNAIFGAVKLLYLSPERLSSRLFQEKVQRMKISLITVDEAHCISQWGYDFRPSYLQIARIRQQLPDAPVLALTATATPRTIDDIQEQLLFKEKRVFNMSFRRENLIYVVRHTDSKEQQLIHILERMEGSAIVYVRSRAATKELATLLNEHDIKATYYNAGLDRSVKDKHQAMWSREQMRVMVATNAFGMGIDKQNVRLVIHYHTPDSLEAYFQEAGRAGRDGKRSYAVLLFALGDNKLLQRRISEQYPPREKIMQIYEQLASFFQIAECMGAGRTFLFDVDRFSVTFHQFPLVVESALKILSQAGYIDYTADAEHQSRVHVLLTKAELSRLVNLSPMEEAVLIALLRNYGGLFADYGYIDEGLLKEQLGISREQVYLLLKGLSQQHIIHYIPPQSLPTVTYLLPRVDTPELVIPTHIYEDRREVYRERINAMLTYVNNDVECRSQQLLTYFGETDSNLCGHCDVCIAKSGAAKEKFTLIQATDRILQMLSDGQPHAMEELKCLPLPHGLLGQALQKLFIEERIQEVDNRYALK